MQRAIEDASQGRGKFVSNPWISVPYASTLFEAGELGQADSILAEHLAAARDASMPDHMICAYTIKSRIAHANNDIVEALRYLCDLEHEGIQHQLPRVASCASLERSRLMVLTGFFDAAEMALSRAEALFNWGAVANLTLASTESFDPTIGRIRLHLSTGRTAEARPLIDQEIKLTDTQGRRRTKLAIFEVIATWNSGDETKACELMKSLLTTFDYLGYFRIVVDEGGNVVPILRRLLLDVSKGARGSRDPVLQVLLERMLSSLGVQASDTCLSEQLEKTLTNKELEILQALTEGKTNLIISQQFQISDSTVRTHLRNINLKLAATSRSQAVANARRLMLVR
jgi:LuxR family maltose regulon positive regulatory protein